jgi:nucleolar GTP-binding protein
MNFQNMKPVISGKQLLDQVFSAARNLERTDDLDLQKVALVSKELSSRLSRIQEGFPSIDRLPLFYHELVRLTIDYQDLKKSLASLPWAADKVKEFGKTAVRSMRTQRNSRINERLRRGYYGRVSSIVKQVSKNLEFLEQCRRVMRSFPDIKDTKTVAIAGYPNVGKSSILARLTGAKPEIKDYPFTTKRLNLGYARGMQFIDTPGTFDREKAEMNDIELQSYLTLEHCADLILFVMDDTQDMTVQEGLLRRMKRFGKPVVVIHSKSDAIERREKDVRYVSSHTGENIEELLDLLEKHESDRKAKDHKD